MNKNLKAGLITAMLIWLTALLVVACAVELSIHLSNHLK
jgi:hypothetical protein